MSKNKRKLSRCSKPLKKSDKQFKTNLQIANEVFPLDKLYVTLSVELEQFLKTVRRDMQVTTIICEFGKHLSERYKGGHNYKPDPDSEEPEKWITESGMTVVPLTEQHHGQKIDITTHADEPKPAPPPLKNIWMISFISDEPNKLEVAAIEAPTMRHAETLFRRSHPGKYPTKIEFRQDPVKTE